MKLLVIMASRGNPHGLTATISSLMGLAGGKHDIVIKVGIDDDDADSLAYTPTIQIVYPNVQFVIVGRKPTLGAVLNDLARNEDADAYIPLTDRMVILTPLWDEIVANASMHFYNHVLWWTAEQGTIMPILTRKWYEASGQVFTEYFPFWFDDTWLAEVNGFVNGNAGYAIPASIWRRPGGSTKRCHDMRFWMDFFISKRQERIETAKKIGKALHLPEIYDGIHEMIKQMQGRDNFWATDWQRLEKEFGDPSEPDFSYHEAQRQAEAFMNPTDETVSRAQGGFGE